MFSVPDAISVRNPVLFKIGILMISTMKSNKPRVLVSGVGTRFGGTETVVSRYIGALSEKYAFDTISSRPYQQVEYSMGDNRIINIPGWKENPIEHITRLRRLFYGHGTEYCAFGIMQTLIGILKQLSLRLRRIFLLGFVIIIVHKHWAGQRKGFPPGHLENMLRI